jgi:hypothetical protein
MEVVFYPLDTRLTIHQVYDWEIHAPYFTQSLVLNMSPQTKPERSRLLDEPQAITGLHRQSLIRLVQGN